MVVLREDQRRAAVIGKCAKMAFIRGKIDLPLHHELGIACAVSMPVAFASTPRPKRALKSVMLLP